MEVQRIRVAEEAKRIVEELVGLELNRVTVGPFDVALGFVGDRTRWVRINKVFQFRLGDGSWSGCDPAARQKGGLEGDVDFVRLVGRTCRRALLTDDELTLAFAEGGALCVGFGPNDLEPVQLEGDGPGEGWFFIAL